jgi:hypothetical protein
MKQFLAKITLEQVINNAQVLLSSIGKTGGMESIIFNLWNSLSTVAIQLATLIFNGPCTLYNIY